MPPYWYAVYLYEFAHYLEVVLSEAVDETYLNYISADMERIYSQFDECNNIYSDAIKKYIDDVKALKANTVPANIIGWVRQGASTWICSSNESVSWTRSKGGRICNGIWSKKP